MKKILLKRTKIVLILVFIMFISIIGGLSIFRYLKTSNTVLKTEVSNPNDVGQFQIMWVNSPINNAGAINEDDHSILQINASENKKYNASSATGGGVHATYQMIFNMGGSEAAPAGAITIKIPRYLFYGRDGNPIASQIVDIPLVEYPNEGGTGFNWRYEQDTDGNDWIVLENNQETSASYTFECSITWILVTPSELADGYEKEISGSVEVDLDQDGTVDMQSDTNVLTLKNSSHAKIYSFYESYNTHRDTESGKTVNVYTNWNNNWSDDIKPSDPENWIYVVWYSYGSIRYATQPYTVTFNDEVTDDEGGQIIGYCRYSSHGSSSANTNSYDNSCFSKTSTATSEDRGSASHKASILPLKGVSPEPYSSSSSYYGDEFQYYYYMVKYPKSTLQDGETHTLKNKATINLVGVDGETDSKTATSQVDYKYVYIEPTDEYVNYPGVVPGPSGSLYDDISSASSSYSYAACGKCSYDSRNNHSSYAQMNGALNTLANSDNNYKIRLGGKSSSYFNWDNYASMQYYNLTYSGTGDDTDLANYGVGTYTVNLVNEDFMASYNDEEYTRLGYGDYELTSFYINYYRHYNYTYQEWTSYNEATKVTTHYTGYNSETNTNYANYPLINIYYKTDGDWELLGKVKTTASGSYKFIDNEGIEKNIGYNNQINLPAGTTGIKASYETNSYSSYVDLAFKANLINSNKVKELYNEKDSLYVYNVNTLYATKGDNIYSAPGYGYSLKSNIKNVMDSLDQDRYGTTNIAHEYDYMLYTRISGGSTSQNKSVTYSNDVLNRRVVANYTAYAYESREFSSEVLTADEIYDYGIINEQRVGTFYDLLPIGVYADLNTIQVKGYKNNNNIPATASVINNWRGTGRDMLVIRAKVDEDKINRYSTSSMAYSGMQLSFKAYYDWDSISDYGNYLTNTIAYKSNSGALSNGFADTLSSISSSTIKDKNYMEDLDEDGNPEGTVKDTVYAQAALSFSFNTASDASFRKGVKTADMTKYVDGHDGSVIATAGGYYTYQLRYQSQKNMKTSDLVLYDVFEEYDDGVSQRWKGSFVSINVLQPEAVGIKPVVYYSTSKNINLYENGKATIDTPHPSDADLSNSDIWSTEAPKDLTKVTAIAIDLRKDNDGNDFILESEESVTITVTMQAPVENAKELEDINAKALNASWWEGTTKQGNEAPHFNFSVYEWTEVLIRDVQIGLDKKSYIESGTQEVPRTVQKGDKIIYDITVDNKSNFESFSEVYVYDYLPSAVTAHPDFLAYYKEGEGDLDNYKLMSEDGVIEFSSDDGYKSIEFKINQLLAGEVVHILIPVTVTTSQKEVIKNETRLIRFNGTECTMISPATYHISDSGSISITKKVDVKHETASIDDNKEFRFKITLSLPAEEGENTGHALTSQIEDLDLLNTQYGTVEFVDGVGFFSLKNGETVNLYNIPIGFGYKIEEYDYSKEGYETIIDNGSGTIDSNEEIKVLVKNTYLLDFRNPETSSNFTLLLILSFGWLISLMLIVIRKKIKVARYS